MSEDIRDRVLKAWMAGDAKRIADISSKCTYEELCSLIRGMLYLTQLIIDYAHQKRGIPLDRLTYGTTCIAISLNSSEDAH